MSLVEKTMHKLEPRRAALLAAAIMLCALCANAVASSVLPATSVVIIEEAD